MQYLYYVWRNSKNGAPLTDVHNKAQSLKVAQRNELVVPGENITEAYTSDLGVSEAFCSLFWIKLESRLFVMTVHLKHLSVPPPPEGTNSCS